MYSLIIIILRNLRANCQGGNLTNSKIIQNKVIKKEKAQLRPSNPQVYNFYESVIKPGRKNLFPDYSFNNRTCMLELG